MAGYILAEAGLSFLGLGIKLPTASWGNLLADAPEYYTSQPWLMVWPGLAVLLTTLAFNLLGDGLRDAFDPRSQPLTRAVSDALSCGTGHGSAASSNLRSTGLIGR